MGDVDARHIVLTGANGFLGKAIARAANRAGHRVTAIVRNKAQDGQIARDLADPDAAHTLSTRIKDADIVIHAAAEMSGDWSRHQSSTLPATQTACDLANTLGAHLVLISSVSVYDYTAVRQGDTVTETTPIETAPILRDGYVQAKLAQEAIVAERCPSASVLRVGALYGKGNLLNAHIGIGIGPLLLRLASNGQIPLTYIDLAADAALRAGTQKAAGAVNILDTDLPDRIRYINALSASGWPRLVLPLSWKIFAALGTVLEFWTNRPGLLRVPVLHARMKPLDYANTRMIQNLGPFETPCFEAQMKQAMRHD